MAREFFSLLEVRHEDGFRLHEGTDQGESSLVYLVDEELASHSAASEPSDSFAKAIEAALLRAAGWLRGRAAGTFERCEARGIKTDICVSSWIDQDQFDLDLPPAFLLACGTANLGISIVTND